MRDKIEELRAEMIELGMRDGFTNPEVVRISQELDKLLNQLGGVIK